MIIPPTAEKIQAFGSDVETPDTAPLILGGLLAAGILGAVVLSGDKTRR